MQIITIDGARMTDRAAMHRYLMEALRLPANYGNNLDALYDCLTDFPADTILVLRHADAIKAQLGGYGEGLLNVFCDAAKTSVRLVIDPS